MAEAFPPIHLYALLAAALAVLSAGINLDRSGQTWLKRWYPFLGVVAAVLHIGVFILLQRLYDPGADSHLVHVVVHCGILFWLVIAGAMVYADRLSGIAKKHSSTLPPLDPEPDGS